MAFNWKSEFQVSSNNGGSGGAPKVAVNHLGQAMVVWQDGSSIKGRSIDAFGNPTGADFTVGSLNTTATMDIDVAPLANGDFVVVHEYQFSGIDLDVRYAHLTAAGAPVASGNVAGEGLVGGLTVNEYDPQVTQGSISDTNNDFVVVYARSAAGPTNDIVMRQFTGTGSIKSTTTVAAGGSTVLVQPDVAVTDNGSSAAVIWRNASANVAQISELQTFDLGGAWSVDSGIPLFNSQNGVTTAPSISRVKLDPTASNLSYATLGGYIAGSANDAVYTTSEDIRTNFTSITFSGFTPVAARTVGLADNRGMVIATDGTTARFTPYSSTESSSFGAGQLIGISGLFDAAVYPDERIILVERGLNPTGGISINAAIVDPRRNGIVHDYSYTFGDPVSVGSELRDIWLRGNGSIFGLGGDDLILGAAGFGYTADGGAGRDFLEGSSGTDFLSGGADPDVIYGNSGNDVIQGDGGDDTLRGDTGADNILGGAGSDWIDGGQGPDAAGYSGTRFSYTLVKTSQAVMVYDNRAGAPDGVDAFRDVERVLFDGASLSAEILTPTNFNRDLRSDLLWCDTSGQAVIFTMNGLDIEGVGIIGGANGPTWRVKASGDINGDGNTDLIWQDTSGQITVWTTDGGGVPTATLLANPGASFRVVGSGDLDGDGKSDIILQDENGQAVAWLMNGASIVSAAAIGGANGAEFSVAAVGDLNGDGKADLVWEHTNGTTVGWLMNGTTIAAAAVVAGANGTGFSVKDIGDIDNNGKGDILWQFSNGQAGAWGLGGASGFDILLNAPIGGANGANFEIREVGDLNGDSKMDLIWQDLSSGQAVGFLLDGTTILAAGDIGGANGAQWLIV